MKKYLPLILFVLLTIVGICCHEIWSDEAHPWVVVRDASFWDWKDIFARDSHSILWPLLVKLAQIIYPQTISLQILSGLIGCVTYFIIWKFSPWNYLEKTLLALNYYFFYEFTVISRNYSLEMLVLVSICALWNKRRERPLLFYSLILLLPFTHVMAGVFALGLFILSLENLYTLKSRRVLLKTFIVSLVFAALYAWGSRRPDDAIAIHFTEFFNFSKLPSACLHLVTTFFLIIRPFGSFWTSPFLPANVVPAFISVLLFGVLFSCVLWAFRKSKRTILILCLGTLPLLTFIYTGQSMFYRHAGHFWLLFFACTWIFYSEELKSKLLHTLFIMTLVCGAYSGVTAILLDMNHPFSQGADVANFLEKFPEDEYVLVADNTLFTASFEAPKARPFIDPPDKLATFAKTKRSDFLMTLGLDPETGLQHVVRGDQHRVSTLRTKFESAGVKKLVVVTQAPLPQELVLEFDLKLKARFNKALVPLEQFHVYSE